MRVTAAIMGVLLKSKAAGYGFNLFQCTNAPINVNPVGGGCGQGVGI